MAKKKLLAANMKRPSLKRELKVTEARMDEVVRKVADNPPPAVSKAGRGEEKIPTSPTSPAPASAPDKERGSKTARAEPVAAKQVAKTSAAPPTPKRGRGRPRKENSAASSVSRSVHPKEGTKRLTLDIPQALHKKLKLLAIHQEISMKDYIIGVVERSL